MLPYLLAAAERDARQVSSQARRHDTTPYATLPTAQLADIKQPEASYERFRRAVYAKTPDAGEGASLAGGEFDVKSYLCSDGARPFRLFDDDAPDHAGLAIALLIDTAGSMDGWDGKAASMYAVCSCRASIALIIA